MSEETKIETKKLNKKLIISAAAVIAVALIVVLAIIVPKSVDAKNLEKQLKLGAKYLSELEYEQAEVAYLEAISIDPKNVEAYLGLAEVYVAQGEYEKAEKVLAEALTVLGGEAAEVVRAKLEEVRNAKTETEVIPTVIPTMTPTAVPEAAVEPTATIVPTYMPTSEPTPTLTSTPTPSLEPTATSTPEPTPTNTPVPAATNTPVPTNTPIPETTEVAGAPELPKELLKLQLGEKDIQYEIANSGVVITVKNELYGAFDYNGKELVPHKYTALWAGPNADGDFCLGNEDKAVVFNSTGDVVYEIEEDEWNGIIEVHIAEGIVTYSVVSKEWPGGSATAYDIAKKEIISYSIVSDNDAINYGMNREYMTAVENGIFYATHGAGVFKVSPNGGAQLIYENRFVSGIPGGQVHYLNSPRDGYGVMFTHNDIDYTTKIGLLDVEGKELVLVEPKKLIAMNEHAANMAIRYYYVNGQYYCNDEKRIVIVLEDGEGNVIECMLLELSKAEIEMKEVWLGDKEYLCGTEPLVVNVEETVIARYEFIVLCDSGRYLASDGEQWFYMDSLGKISKSYQDASAFRNGYAVVIDEDGYAYFIDKEFHKVSGAYPADFVATIGNGFLIRKEGQEDIVFVFNE